MKRWAHLTLNYNCAKKYRKANAAKHVASREDVIRRTVRKTRKIWGISIKFVYKKSNKKSYVTNWDYFGVMASVADLALIGIGASQSIILERLILDARKNELSLSIFDICTN